jgi:hypothetical protein
MFYWRWARSLHVAIYYVTDASALLWLLLVTVWVTWLYHPTISTYRGNSIVLEATIGRYV